MLDKAPLLRFGNDPASVKAALEREFTVFEALPAALAEVWLTPRKPGAWSPAQVTEHVIKVNVGMSKTLYLLRRAAPLPEAAACPRCAHRRTGASTRVFTTWGRARLDGARTDVARDQNPLFSRGRASPSYTSWRVRAYPVSPLLRRLGGAGLDAGRRFSYGASP